MAKSVAQVSDFFKKCGTEGCKQLKAVAKDQNAGFAKCVEKYCPNAKVVYDQFHLISNFGRMVISAIRIRLSNQCEENGNKDAASLLKGSAPFSLHVIQDFLIIGVQSLMTY